MLIIDRKSFFYRISILRDSEILDQLTNLEKSVDSKVTKSKRGRKKKINEFSTRTGAKIEDDMMKTS